MVRLRYFSRIRDCGGGMLFLIADATNAMRLPHTTAQRIASAGINAAYEKARLERGRL